MYIVLDNDGFVLFKSEIQTNDSIEISENELIEISTFIKPKKVEGVWTEGLTLQEIEVQETEKVNSAIDFIQTKYIDLLKSSLQRVTGKTGSLEYLTYQRNEYEKKYICALEILNNENVSNLNLKNSIEQEKEFEDFAGVKLTNTLQSYGLTTLNDRLKDYCQIVKFKYEYANPIFLEMEAMIIYFRTRMVTDVEFGLWEKYNMRKQMVFSIVPETTIEEMRILYNQSKQL